MAEQVLSVKELNSYMQQAVRRAAFLQQLTVSGELSNLKKYNSGHWYFTLKDSEAQVSCVMFRGYNQAIDFEAHDGMQVELQASADFYVKGGTFQLMVKSMSQAGLGQLYLAYERLKAKLEEEGLFRAEHKKALPFLPRRIGVITSPDGAVIRDIIHVLSRRFPNFRLLLAPVQVQGQGAAESMIKALHLLQRQKDIDVIIIGRGGGSIEDLWAFNDEGLARAIFAANIPVISAVGHETDFSICDFVSDLRAPTPSAAAELAVPAKADLLYTLSELNRRLKLSWRKYLLTARQKLLLYTQSPFLKQAYLLIDQRRKQLASLLKDRILRDPSSLIRERQIRVDQLRQTLETGLRHCLELNRQRLLKEHQALFRAGEQMKREDKERLGRAAARLDALSPLKVVARGYALVLNPETHKPYTSTAVMRIGSPMELVFSDGRVRAKVEELKGGQGLKNLYEGSNDYESEKI